MILVGEKFFKICGFFKKDVLSLMYQVWILIVKSPQNSKKYPDYLPCWVLDISPGDLEFENLINGWEQ